MLPGVQKVSRQGGADRVIRIEPDADKLSALNLSVVTVNEWLRGVHQNAAGGSSQYNSLAHTIRVLGEKQRLMILKAFSCLLKMSNG